MMAMAVARTQTDSSRMAPATAAMAEPANTSRYAAMTIAAIGRMVSPSITGIIWRDILALVPVAFSNHMPEAGAVSKHWDGRTGQSGENRLDRPKMQRGPERCAAPAPVVCPCGSRPQATEARIFGILSEKISSIWFSLIISGGDRAMVSAVMRTIMPTSWKPFSIAL